MWPFKRKEQVDPLTELIDKVDEFEEQLRKTFERFEKHIQRLEDEKKTLAAELRSKTSLIENLFSQMLTNSYQQPKKEEKKEDENLVDISKLSETHKSFVRGKLAEANKSVNGNSAKKP